MFDLTFDLSAFDMFVSWERGACVCCLSPKTLINPGEFIRGHVADSLVLGTLNGFTDEAIGFAEAGRVSIPETEPVLR
jgi:hypothetical protein